MEILYFLDNVEERRRRRDMVLSAAVAAGAITAVQAWPEYFEGIGTDEGDPGAFPSADADMSGFELEKATPESVMADLDALVSASRKVTIREEDQDPFPGLGETGPPHPEWT